VELIGWWVELIGWWVGLRGEEREEDKGDGEESGA
jgi:hypothetical protein